MIKKTIICVVLALVSTGAMARDYIDVRCKDPFDGLLIYEVSKIDRATSGIYGTSIVMVDGTTIDYGPQTECRITTKK